MMDGSGLPIPGLFRIEGSIDFDAAKDSDRLDRYPPDPQTRGWALARDRSGRYVRDAF